MITLVIGLILFLGIHAVRIVAPGAREAAIERFGAGAWQGVYSVLSLLGLILVGRGYSAAYGTGEWLYDPPDWGRLVAYVAMLFAFVFAIASGGPPNHVRRWVGDPLLIATILWAGSHLFVRSDTVHVVLLGGFLVWAIADLVSSRRRRAMGISTSPSYVPADAEPRWSVTAVAVVAGIILYVLFVVWAHEWLFGVSPVG